MTWTVFVFSVLLIGVSSASVVRRDVHQNSENPTVTEVENPETDEEPGTDDPERSEFQGWNRQQVLNYMSGENGYSSSSYTTEETLKRQRIAEIREQILQTLGISDPTAHSTPKLTEHQESELISTFNRSRAISDRTRTFECVVAACEMPMNQSLHVRQVNAKSMQLYFDTYFSDDEKRITNSTLKLCLKELTERQRQRLLRTYDPRLEVRVYMYLPTRRANGRPRRTVVDITMVSPDVENWVLLDIKPAVRRWKRDPSANYGLEVVVKNTQEQRLNANQLFVGVNCTLNETNVCVPSHNLEEALGVPRDLPDYDNNMAPNLHLVKEEEQYSTSEINVDRIRRDVHANAPCVKYPLTVSLSDLGWNNMAFRPNTINVGMCVGNCTSNDDDSPECTRCFPTRYKSMFLAYRDSRGNTGSGNVEDVIVDECGVLESA